MQNCPKVFAPVCSDDTTYDNACSAEADGETVFTEGICDVRAVPDDIRTGLRFRRTDVQQRLPGRTSRHSY